jgi:very-short-patch-repair endonuclease
MPPLLAAFAGRQYGVVARRQLLGVGVPDSTIDSWLQRRRLFPLHRAVYAVGHEAVEQRGRELAAVLAVGDDALLGHQPAGARWRMRPPWQGVIHVVSPRLVKVEGVAVHRARSIDPRDRTIHQGIPITTPARTLLDLAEVLPERQLEDALAEAAIRELATDLEDVIARSSGRRGASVLTALLRDVAPTRSVLEREFLRLLADHDLPRPLVNARVNGYEVDAHWPAARLIVELDGFRVHGTRRAFERDRERDAELLAAGWRVIRITFRQLRRAPGAVAARLRRALHPATPSPGGSSLASISPGVSPA